MTGLLTKARSPRGGVGDPAVNENVLYYGDNLNILRNREYFPDESVDLIYLDPPFNSNRTYNVLYKEESGTESEAQITAFEDTWRWNEGAERTFHELITQAPPCVGKMVGALRDFIGNNQMMAYLVMMAIRLVELHRVLKPTGSIYLHCDPTANHYLKVVMDTVFDAENLRNEIVWHYGGRGAKAIAKQFGRNHDVILYYSKRPGSYVFNRQYMRRVFSPEDARRRGFRQDDTGRWFKTAPRGDYTDESIRRLDAEGRVYRTRTGGVRVKYFLSAEKENVVDEAPLGDTWFDIPDAMHFGRERLGYMTQKPLALLERIISASSNEGDVVLDPFCGCGTTVCAAQKLNRRWIGIDITHLAVALQKSRLKDMFGIEPGLDYRVVGEPEDLASARALAEANRYQFQWWALSLVGARPVSGEQAGKRGRKGPDRGIDGVIAFLDDPKKKPKQVVVQVKSGKVGVGDVRDLRGVVERENAAIGVLVTLEEPTRLMRTESAGAGFYHSESYARDYPRLQVFTVQELLAGTAGAAYPAPRQTNRTFRRAPRVQPQEKVNQGDLF
jgi:site-specific DNA-methyltransferase (adenine-specific)